MVALKHVFLVHEEHRLIIVRLSNHTAGILFVVAHVPHVGCTADGGADRYWEAVETHVSWIRRTSETIVLITDANAQLRSNRLDCIVQAESFAQCLNILELTEQTTDEANIEGDSYLVSYIGKGSACQLDYIATNAGATPLAGSARALTSFAPTVACLDHIPLAIDVVVTPFCASKPTT